MGTTKRALYYTLSLIFCIFSCWLFLEAAPWEATLGERQGPFTRKPTNPGSAPSHLHSLALSLSPAQGPSVLITARPGPRQPAVAAEPTVFIQTSQSEASLPLLASLFLWKPQLRCTHIFSLTPSALIDPVALRGMPRPCPEAPSSPITVIPAYPCLPVSD